MISLESEKWPIGASAISATAVQPHGVLTRLCFGDAIKPALLTQFSGPTKLRMPGYLTFRSGYIISIQPQISSEGSGRVTVAAIELALNRRSYTVDADPQTSLLTVLRENLDLTGTKYGCGEGQCGACTVLIDGRAQRSCVTRVGTVAKKQITSIEGLAHNEQLHPVQQAFLDEGAMQCGYCTPGMIMSAVSLLNRNHHPSRAEIIGSLDGNICRCGAYSRIVSAVQKAAAMVAESAGIASVGNGVRK